MRYSIVRKLAAAAPALSLALQSCRARPLPPRRPASSRPTIEADQAIRFETELMVLSDTCGDDTYRDFTLRNRERSSSLSEAADDYFRRTGARSPQASLDTFLTASPTKSRPARRPTSRHRPCAASADLPGGGEIPEYAAVPAPRRGARGGE